MADRHPQTGRFVEAGSNPDEMGQRQARNGNVSNFTLVPAPESNPSVSAAQLEQIAATEAHQAAAQQEINK